MNRYYWDRKRSTCWILLECFFPVGRGQHRRHNRHISRKTTWKKFRDSSPLSPSTTREYEMPRLGTVWWQVFNRFIKNRKNIDFTERDWARFVPRKKLEKPPTTSISYVKRTIQNMWKLCLSPTMRNWTCTNIFVIMSILRQKGG